MGGGIPANVTWLSRELSLPPVANVHVRACARENETTRRDGWKGGRKSASEKQKERRRGRYVGIGRRGDSLGQFDH